MFIEVKDARKQYGSGEAAVYALDGIDFTLDEGKICVILGPSGSGKSTLLNMIGGLDSLDSGEIAINGANITGLSKKALTAYRKENVGFVFQFYNLTAFFYMLVVANSDSDSGSAALLILFCFYMDAPGRRFRISSTAEPAHPAEDHPHSGRRSPCSFLFSRCRQPGLKSTQRPPLPSYSARCGRS